MAKSKSNTNATIKEYDPCKGRPYNRYNIYYILERERYLQSFPGYSYKNEQQQLQQATLRTSTTTATDGGSDDNYSANTVLTGYENLGQLPPLPPRYAELELSDDWYMPGKRKLLKRDHKKTHGVASFQEIARVVADGWRSIDEPTLEYCTAIAKILKLRHVELKKVGGLKNLASDKAAKKHHSSCESLTDAPLKSLVMGREDDDDEERPRPGSPKKKGKARCRPKAAEACADPVVSTRMSVRTEVDFPLPHSPVAIRRQNSSHTAKHGYSNTYHHGNDYYPREYAPSSRGSSPVSSSEGHYYHHHHHHRSNDYYHPHSLPSSRRSSPIHTPSAMEHYAAREYASASPPSSYSRRSWSVPENPSAEMNLHDQAVMAVCGNKSDDTVGSKGSKTTWKMTRRNSEPAIHSEVDIPDQEIRAMWLK